MRLYCAIWRFVCKLIDCAVPECCFVCGNVLTSNEKNNWICSTCDGLFVPVNQNECCQKCGYPMQKENFLDTYSQCQSCTHYRPYFLMARSAMQYRDGARRALLLLKFHFNTDGLKFIGERMYEAYLQARMQRPDIVCFVPITRRKLFFNGFNHAALVANAFIQAAREHGENLNLVYDLLVKTAKTQQSKELNQAGRLQKKHFVELNKRHIETIRKAKNILVIDDIMTTGGTLNNAAKVIISSNPRCKVSCLTFARTMLY